jgi:hypothetical protein
MMETLFVIAPASSNHAKPWSRAYGQEWKLDAGAGLDLPALPTRAPIREAAMALERSGYPRETFFALMTPKNEILACLSVEQGLRMPI